MMAQLAVVNCGSLTMAFIPSIVPTWTENRKRWESTAAAAS